MRIFASVFAASALLASAASADQLWLTLDQVRPYDLERPAGQIVVGNPAIADVTVQDKSRVLLFGKMPGMTNMYIFDDEGNVIDNLVLRVRSSTADMLTMHRGAARTTYNCTDRCEAAPTVGDDKTTYQEVTGQASRRLQQAKGGANSDEGTQQ
jgi:hypothetical protein